MTPDEMGAEMARLSRLLDAGLSAIREHAVKAADAEMTYRQGRAQAWIQVPPEVKLARHRDDWVDGQTSALRRDRDIADGMNRAAIEAVRARRAQISALQSLLNAHRAEAEFGRTGPE
jgi:hypothetical protein